MQEVWVVGSSPSMERKTKLGEMFLGRFQNPLRGNPDFGWGWRDGQANFAEYFYSSEALSPKAEMMAPAFPILGPTDLAVRGFSQRRQAELDFQP